jgi:hypothetical protein
MGHRSLNAQGTIDENARSAQTRAAYDRSIAIQNEKATQVTASQASSVEDCIELLAMLGLDARAARRAS